MQIRQAIMEDLGRIIQIYGIAKKYMDDNGNSTQWKPGYPTCDMIQADITKKQLYVCTENEQIHGVFAFILGEDETYRVIENGAWLDASPYGTIHRLASDGQVKGIFTTCVSFCASIEPHLRADTHHDNLTMQHLLEKSGFTCCGIIYVADGTPRIAYELSYN